MKKIEKEQQLNYLSIDLLEKLGNRCPSQVQIDLMESLLNIATQDYRLTVDRQLTPREVSCLFLAAKGYTSDETARLLNIKASTVNTHRREIIRKLSADNITHAVFTGLQYRLIIPAKN